MNPFLKKIGQTLGKIQFSRKWSCICCQSLFTRRAQQHNGQINVLQRIYISQYDQWSCVCMYVCIHIMYLLIHQTRAKLLDTMGRSIDWLAKLSEYAMPEEDAVITSDAHCKNVFGNLWWSCFSIVESKRQNRGGLDQWITRAKKAHQTHEMENENFKSIQQYNL